MRAATVRLAAFLATAAGPAWAHGGLPGGGGFLSGALHPFVAVPHLILLLGLGLLAAALPFDRRGLTFITLGLGLLAAFALSWAETPSPTQVTAVAILGLAVLAGGLAALAPPRLPPWLVAALALPAGFAVALDTDLVQARGLGAPAPVASMIGVVVGVFLIVLDTAALATLTVRRPAFGIVARVAGSWIAAIGLILLTLSITPVRAAG